MKLKVKQNSAAIMLRSFILMITMIIVLSSMATVLAVSHQLLEASQTNTANIIASLEKTVIDGNDDWKNWRLNSIMDTSTSYVHVYNMRTDATIKNYYSPGTKQLLSTQPRAVPLIHNLYYRPHTGLLYYGTGHARGINYQLWVNLHSQLETLQRVILVTVFILIITLLISPLYIRALADRLTNSLAKLTNSAETISMVPNQTEAQLPVPKRPTEVTDLATSFNRLLRQVYQQSEQEKSFVANAAHELRTPIATIRSHAQLIQRRGATHPEIIAQSVKYINEESQQMQNLVAELLTLSRADRTTLDLTEYDLSQALTRVVAKLTPLLQQPLVTAIPPHIKVTAHAASVDQMVVNLVNNAGKYTPATSPITLTLITTATQIMIQVADQGSGIAAVDQPHIFERFYRSSDIRGTIPGTGLGLAIVQQLAQLNHIQVSLTGNRPHGSVFTLTFQKKQI